MVSVVALALIGSLDVDAGGLVGAVVVLRVDTLVVILDGEPGHRHSFVAQRKFGVPVNDKYHYETRLLIISCV